MASPLPKQHCTFSDLLRPPLRCAGHGIFKGTVVEYYGSSGFRIEYEDGDSEDVTHETLVRFHSPLHEWI